MATANHLIHETSPYLRQHAYNPVDWYPWGEEALQHARAENKPILLSIGYAACHWCHVMAHESFDDPDTAALLNDHFISIKVDREERPDLDSIYMDAVQAMTGAGGWPMTVFLTPDLIPFYAGTYFPPSDRHGLPGFKRVLVGVADAWRNRPQDVAQTVSQMANYLTERKLQSAADQVLTPDLLDQAAQGFARQFDPMHGGFGRAPKFPQPMALEFLLRQYQRTGDVTVLRIVEQTLQKMARGGIYDQLGGGFHRYSVDLVWLVPHFEKMLYDNAQLAWVYLAAYQVTGQEFYRRIVEETLDYVLRDMTHPDGGFYSTQDADSEGEEGKFYVWSAAEIDQALDSDDARLFKLTYGVSDRGNWEGKNILFLAREPDEVAADVGVSVEAVREAIARGRRTLFERRATRVAPGRDEKILTSWNGLMIRAFAEAGRALGRRDYRDAAVRAANFVLAKLGRDGRLLRTYKDDVAKLNGFLEDYVFLADGLLALYAAAFDLGWFREAHRLVDAALEWFWDDESGSFYDTSRDHEQLITRPRDFYDNATPAGNSVAAELLLRLANYTRDDGLRQRARAILAPLAGAAGSQPLAFGRLVCALDLYFADAREVAIVGDVSAADTTALLDVVNQKYRPYLAVAAMSPDDEQAATIIPLLHGRSIVDGKATAYVCKNFACQMPTTDPNEFAEQLT